VFPVNIQRNLVYIGIVEAQGDNRDNDFLDKILVDSLSVLLALDEPENSTSEIVLHLREETDFPQKESELNAAIGTHQ